MEVDAFGVPVELAISQANGVMTAIKSEVAQRESQLGMIDLHSSGGPYKPIDQINAANALTIANTAWDAGRKCLVGISQSKRNIELAISAATASYSGVNAAVESTDPEADFVVAQCSLQFADYGRLIIDWLRVLVSQLSQLDDNRSKLFPLMQASIRPQISLLDAAAPKMDGLFDEVRKCAIRVSDAYDRTSIPGETRVVVQGDYAESKVEVHDSIVHRSTVGGLRASAPSVDKCPKCGINTLPRWKLCPECGAVLMR